MAAILPHPQCVNNFHNLDVVIFYTESQPVSLLQMVLVYCRDAVHPLAELLHWDVTFLLHGWQELGQLERNQAKIYSMLWIMSYVCYCHAERCMQYCVLTHCGLVTPYGNINLSQHWLGSSSCYLTAPSHYLNQSWLIISEVQRQSPEGDLTKDTSAINHQNYLENHFLKCHSNISGANELMELNCILLYIDGLMQERRNSIAQALELRLSCINPSISPSNFHTSKYF